MNRLKQIAEGWKNHLFPGKSDVEIIEEVSRGRMTFCSICEYNSKNVKEKSIRPDEHCTICKCTLSAKTKCLTCSCPKDKWKGV